MKICLRALMLAAVVWALAAPPVSATLILPQSLDTLTRTSSHVLHGKVLSMESRWNDEGTLIVTDVYLDVAEAFKGRIGGPVVLTLHGGRVDDLVLDVVGSPTFQVGEEVLIFARRQPDGSFNIPDLYQGKYRVEREADGAWIANEQYSLDQLLPDKATVLDARGRLSWDTFRQQLVSAVERARGGAR